MLLSNPELAGTLRPDLVLRLGQPPINWPVIRWVDSLEARTIVVSAAYDSDPSHAVDGYFVCDEEAFLNALRRRLPSTSPPSTWRDEVIRHGRQARKWVDAQLEDAPLVDGRVAHELVRAMPGDANLVVSSSMPLRELEAFGMPRKEPLRIFCNRGLNGIDGVVSTAYGVSVTRDEPTALLIGDVALAHDVGALQLGARLGTDLTIVLVDNSGGAIFDHLPVAGMEPMYERHFVTRPGLQWRGAQDLFGVDVTEVDDAEALRLAVEESFDRAGTRLIVVRTDRARSKDVRDRVLTGFEPIEADDGE